MKQNITQRVPWVTLTLAAVAVMVHTCGLDARLQWSSHEQSSSFTQTLRIWTSHLTHWNAQHLLWNAAVLLVLGSMLELKTRTGMAACVLIGAPAIIGLVQWTTDQPVIYRGLSGLDSGLFVMAAILMMARQWPSPATILPAMSLVLFAGKTLYECTTGTLLFVTPDGFAPSPASHMAGGSVGAAVAMGHLLLRRWRQTTSWQVVSVSTRRLPGDLLEALGEVEFIAEAEFGRDLFICKLTLVDELTCLINGSPGDVARGRCTGCLRETSAECGIGTVHDACCLLRGVAMLQ